MSNPIETPQKSFEVTFTRMVSQSTVVRVLAADKKAATALGWEKFEKTRSDLEWEDGDEEGEIERADTQEVELVDDSQSLTSAPQQ
jgi:L-lactate utilization protein LutC